MIDRAQQAADAIDSVAALTAHQARSVLNEYTKDDLIAAIATGHGGQAGGGVASVKHVVVGIDYTDIVVGTGFADLYLLPEGETIVATWLVVTEVFDGLDSGLSVFGSVTAFGPSGSAGGAIQLSDAFSAVEVSATSAVDGLIFPGPVAATSTLNNLPLVGVEPGGPPVQTILDFASGLTPITQGTQGHLDFHLVIAVAP